jgi:hypothetical protein
VDSQVVARMLVNGGRGGDAIMQWIQKIHNLLEVD